MTHARTYFTRAAALIAALGICVSLASENFIALPTELKISSVSVSVRAPLGLRYRPGEAFPLEIWEADAEAFHRPSLEASRCAGGAQHIGCTHGSH